MNRGWLIVAFDTEQVLNKYLFSCIQLISLSLLLQMKSRVLSVNLSIYCKMSFKEMSLSLSISLQILNWLLTMVSRQNSPTMMSLYQELWRWGVILKSIIRSIIINCYLCRVLCCFQGTFTCSSHLTLITLGDGYQPHFTEKESEPLIVIDQPKPLRTEKWKSWDSNFLTSNSGLLWYFCLFVLYKSSCACRTNPFNTTNSHLKSYLCRVGKRRTVGIQITN